jgi:hypothetical protein
MANIGTLTAHIGADTKMLAGGAAIAKKMFRGMAVQAKHSAADIGRSFDIIRATTLGIAPPIMTAGAAISNFTPYMVAMGAAAKSAAIPIGYVKTATSDLIIPSKYAGKAMEETAKGAASASSRMSELGSSIKSSMKPMLALVGVTGGVILLTKAIAKLSEVTRLAARIEVMNHVLEMTGEAAGYTESELKKYRNQIRGLGIATKEAIGIEQLFIQSQLDIADALKISRAAQNLATIAGMNSSEAAKTLTQAIVAQRPILLKQFGIIASLDKIYNKQAKTLGKTRAELTETEKRQGFMNEILAQASTIAGAYETAMRDVGKQITSLPRYYADAAAALGEHFLPQMEFAVGAATKLAKAVTKMFRSVEDATGVFYASRNAFEDNAGATIKLADEYDDLKKKGKLSTEQQAELRIVIERLTAIMPAAADQWDEANRVIGINTDRLRANIEQQRALFRVKQADVIKNWKEEWERLNRQLKVSEHEARVVANSYEEMDKFLAQAGSTMGDWIRYQGLLADTNPAESIAELHGEMNDLIIALSQGYDAINDFARVQRDFAEYPGLAEGILKLQLAEQEAVKLREANNAVAASVDKIRTAYEEFFGMRAGAAPTGVTPIGPVKAPGEYISPLDQIDVGAGVERVDRMVKLYRDLASSGRATARELQSLWGDYSRQRDIQIQAESDQLLSMGVNADIVAATMADRYRQLNDEMKEIFEEQGSWMEQWAQATADAMQNAFGYTFFEWLEGRVGGVRGIIEGITESFLSAMNRIIAQAAAQRLTAALLGGGTPMPTFGAPELALQHGGMVTRPTLAMVGEAGPEMIIPLDKLRDQKFWSDLTGGAGQGDIHVTQNIQTPSPNAFQDSQSLIATQLAAAVNAARRNM